MSKAKQLLTRVKKHLSRNKRRSNSAIQGAVFAASAHVGVRKENGIHSAVLRGIAASTPRKKSKKQLRREKDARYFNKLEEKRYEGVVV